MPASNADVAALLQRLPDTDEPGKESKFTGPPPAVAEEVFEAILAGGGESIFELVRLVAASTDGEKKDFRAAYVLHGLAIHVGHPGKEAQRRVLEASVAAQLKKGGLSKGVQATLIRVLQVVADAAPESAASLGALSESLLDPELCGPAAQALVAIGAGADALRAALPRADVKCRAAIVQALGALADPQAASALKAALGDPDREVRICAAWGLARVGGADAVDALIGASAAQDGWERTQAVKACLMLAESRIAAGDKDAAKRVYTHLRDTRRGTPDEYVCGIAEKGLAAAQ